MFQTRRDRDGSNGPAADGLSRPNLESLRRVVLEDGAEAAGGLQSQSPDHGHELGELILKQSTNKS